MDGEFRAEYMGIPHEHDEAACAAWHAYDNRVDELLQTARKYNRHFNAYEFMREVSRYHGVPVSEMRKHSRCRVALPK